MEPGYPTLDSFHRALRIHPESAALTTSSDTSTPSELPSDADINQYSSYLNGYGWKVPVKSTGDSTFSADFDLGSSASPRSHEQEANLDSQSVSPDVQHEIKSNINQRLVDYLDLPDDPIDLLMRMNDEEHAVFMECLKACKQSSLHSRAPENTTPTASTSSLTTSFAQRNSSPPEKRSKTERAQSRSCVAKCGLGNGECTYNRTYVHKMDWSHLLKKHAGPKKAKWWYCDYPGCTQRKGYAKKQNRDKHILKAHWNYCFYCNFPG
ncbi:hypothetical protein BD413DRAFT_494960 [Trametes elegans]|nr:hypothetical protein BD413DRAFT_494960 [Trametes elegans]